MDKLIEQPDNNIVDYRIVRLTDGSVLVGSITIDKDFLRIQNPLQLKSVPRIGKAGSERLKAIPGQPPSLINLPTGCAFAPRCEYISLAPGDSCQTLKPDLLGLADSHRSRCHVPEGMRDKSFAAEIKGART